MDTEVIRPDAKLASGTCRVLGLPMLGNVAQWEGEIFGSLEVLPQELIAFTQTLGSHNQAVCDAVAGVGCKGWEPDKGQER